jgi:hypothetical protein
MTFCYNQIMSKKKLKDCPICGQKMDLIVTSHKNSVYIDNKTYEEMCFTCFSAPKITKQTLDSDGFLKSEIQLDYSIKNLHNATELYRMGSSDSIGYASKCLKAIKKLKIKQSKKTCKTKPKLIVKLP